MPKISKKQRWLQNCSKIKVIAESLEVKNYGLAIEGLKSILFTNHKNPLLLYLLSYCYKKQGRQCSVLEAKVKQQYGYYTYFKMEEQQFLLVINELFEKWKKIDSIDQNPNSAIEVINCLYVQHAYQEVDEIIEIFEEVAIIKTMTNPNFHAPLAYACYENDNFDKAIEYYKIAAKLGQEFRFCNNLGLLYFCRKQIQEAKQHLFRALELKPMWPRSLYILSFCHYEQKNFEQSLTTIALAIEAEPKVIFYHLKNICIQILLGKIDLTQLQKSISKPLQMVWMNQKDDTGILRQFFFAIVARTIIFFNNFFSKERTEKQIHQLQIFCKVLDQFLAYGTHYKCKLQRKLSSIMNQMSCKYEDLKFTENDENFITVFSQNKKQGQNDQ